MDWARMLAYVTGTVDQELLARNFTYVARGEKGGKGGTGKGGVFEKGKRYPITVEALKTRWQRDRAKAALVLPSVANIIPFPDQNDLAM
jgi:hypothetical protein